LCRSCGAIVGAGEAQCAVCGAATAKSGIQQQKSVVTDRETIKFARAVLNRPFKFTIILLVANVFVFLLMWESSGLTGRALWEFPEPVLLAYGAKLNYLINVKHEWWRFVTPMFVHVNLPHLLVNMYSLWIVGPYVEKLYGSAKFVVFWVLTGIAGVAASYLTVRPNMPANAFGHYLFKSQDVPSAGASGALFGLVGVLFVFGIKFRRELPEGFKRAFGTGMLPIIMINLFIGYLGRGFIDNAAHLGGLLSGAGLALVVQYRRPGERVAVAATWRVLQATALALVAFSFFKIAQHMNIPQVTPATAQNAQPDNARTAVFVNYLKAMNEAQEVLSEVIHDKEVSHVAQALQNLQSAPSLDSKSDELRGRLLGLLTKAGTTWAPSPSPEQGQKLVPKPVQDLNEEFAQWRRDYNDWLKTAVRNYNGPS
jgi:membrane associated rhomboid family serine protease